MSKSKINAAKGALEYVKNGMCIGLGSGSTAREFLKLLVEKVEKEKLKVCCVTTSTDTRKLAIEHKLWVVEPDTITDIDLAVDGADTVSRDALLKGGGGALTREKIIDYNAKKFIVIVDEGKVREKLVGNVALEVLPFAAPFVLKQLSEHNPRIRMAERKLGPVISDNGSFIVDMEMVVTDPKKTEEWLKSIPGIIENGIFTKFDKIIVGTEEGFREL
ncbi:MAG: ribose 5-phosphate isomerase A [Candidatus Hodarchaeales archaeon]|jgi:ribose 5-phosphate isomerase A